MPKFIQYNSTPKFYDVMHYLEHKAAPGTVVRFKGTVKLHGTNAAIVFSGDDLQDWHCQSRNRIITPQSDNYGFANWAHANLDLITLLRKVAKEIQQDNQPVAFFGEWAGKGIFENVGVGQLPKAWYIFAANISGSNEKPKYVQSDVPAYEHVHSIYEFPFFKSGFEVGNAESIARFQNWMVKFTQEVEACCPVAQALLPEDTFNLLGEGIVWRAYESTDPNLDLSTCFFKVKGEAHAVSKVKTLVSVDPELVKTIGEFIDYAVTDNRLNQGLEYLKEMGMELHMKNTGEYLKWVANDVFKEELASLHASNLEPKDVSKQLNEKAKAFWFKYLKAA